MKYFKYVQGYNAKTCRFSAKTPKKMSKKLIAKTRKFRPFRCQKYFLHKNKWIKSCI